MKFKTTQKEIKANFSTVIAVPYCKLQTLLSIIDPIAYTVRREGWASDIYICDNWDLAISTGYSPFGNLKPTTEMLTNYEMLARHIMNSESAYDYRCYELEGLVYKFITECKNLNE